MGALWDTASRILSSELHSIFIFILEIEETSRWETCPVLARVGRVRPKVSQQEGAGPSFNVAVDAVDVCSWMRWPKIRGIERERKKVVVLPPARGPRVAWQGVACGLDKSIRGVQYCYTERVGKRGEKKCTC